jgi:hypothetical protein
LLLFRIRTNNIIKDFLAHGINATNIHQYQLGVPREISDVISTVNYVDLSLRPLIGKSKSDSIVLENRWEAVKEWMPQAVRTMVLKDIVMKCFSFKPIIPDSFSTEDKLFLRNKQTDVIDNFIRQAVAMKDVLENHINETRQII